MVADVMAMQCETVVVWPVVLGMGPVVGILPALLRLGLEEPQRAMYKILKVGVGRM